MGKPAHPTTKQSSIVEVNTTLDNHQLAVLEGLTKVDEVSTNNGKKVGLSTIR